MFKELGYLKEKDNETVIEYEIKDGWDEKQIYFWLEHHHFECVENYEGMWVDMRTLKAINKKCEELGWI